MSRLLFGELPEKYEQLGVAQESLVAKDGKPHILLTCFPDADGIGRYLLWRDHFTHKWRWALRVWPDDDLGLPNHGAAGKLEEAVARCGRHLRERQQLGQSRA